MKAIKEFPFIYIGNTAYNLQNQFQVQKNNYLAVSVFFFFNFFPIPLPLLSPLIGEVLVLRALPLELEDLGIKVPPLSIHATKSLNLKNDPSSSLPQTSIVEGDNGSSSSHSLICG